MNTEDAIDWTRLEELRDEVGDDDFAEIAALFVTELRDGAGGLAACRGTELSAALHAIRGSALNLGFRAVAEACRAAELAGACDAAGIAALCEKCEVILTTRFPEVAA